MLGIGLVNALGCDSARKSQADQEMAVIQPAAEGWRSTHGGCPSVSGLLDAGSIAADTVHAADPWGTPYAITCTDDRLETRSFGADRTRGTGDDRTAEFRTGVDYSLDLQRKKVCPDLPTWDACAERGRSAGLAARAESAAAAQARAAAEPKAFVTWIAAHRGSPEKFVSDPDCDTTGPSAGLCTGSVEDGTGDDAPTYDVRFFRGDPTAVRYTAHFSVAVSCAALGGVATKHWNERPGILGASGERCEFRTAPIAGLSAVIENNKDRSGVYNTGVHVFSAGYIGRDASFRSGVQEDEVRAR